MVTVRICGASAASAALFCVIVYGLATRGALAMTAAVERDQGDDSPAAFAGLVHRSPWQLVALLIYLTSLAGISPLAGFVGKFALFGEAMAASAKGGSPGLTWLVALAAVMRGISPYEYLSILKQAFVNEGPEGGEGAAIGLAHVLAVGLPALALVILGLFPVPSRCPS